MNPNDVEMVRAYTRQVGGTVLDETFPEGTDVEVAIDCEAGDAIFALAPPFTLTIYVRDLMENNEIDHTDTISGALGGANWADPATVFEFTVPAGPPPLQKGHVFNVLAVLSVGGAATPIVSFAESNMMVIS